MSAQDGGTLIVGHSAYDGTKTQLHVEWVPPGESTFGEHVCIASSLFDTKLALEESVALAGSTLYFPVTIGEQIGIARYTLRRTP